MLSEISITDLLDINIIQKMQNIISDLTGIAAITTDLDGVPVTKESNYTDFCKKYTMCSELGGKRCAKCTNTAINEMLKQGKPYMLKCHAGLYLYIIPIMIKDKCVDCIKLSQNFCEPVDYEKLRSIAVELDIDSNEYIEAARQIKSCSTEEFEKSVESFLALADVISMMLYNNHIYVKRIKETERNVSMKSNYTSQNLIMNLKLNMMEWSEKVRVLTNNVDIQNFNAIKKQLISETENLYDSVLNNANDKKGEFNLNFKYIEKPYDLKKMIMDICNEAKKICTEKNIRIECIFSENLHEILFGNNQYLRYVVEFILVNFINKAEGEEIIINVSTEKYSYSQILKISFSVSHIVISRERINEILNSFSGYNIRTANKNLDNANYSYAGVIIRKMYGNVSVKSSEETGTVMTLSLPQIDVREG